MKNLIVFVSLNLLVSCSTFGAGKRCPCEELRIPPKPDLTACIANGDGTMWCNGELFPDTNMVCRSPANELAIVTWIETVWSAINR